MSVSEQQQAQPAVLQICISCRTAENKAELEAADGGPVPERSGQVLFERVRAFYDQDKSFSDHITLQAVECMNGCASGCAAAFQGDGKYSFLIGNLNESDERVADLTDFAKAYSESDKGLPAWRERPVHIRKNTLARLHPMPAARRPE